MLFLPGFALGPVIPTHADGPEPLKPTINVTGKFIPDPPRQDEDWIPPVSKVPKEFVRAARALFNQGMADPRGCEYRVIEVTTTPLFFLTGPEQVPDLGVQVARTHGWVIPARSGDTDSYAVCWNGLVYPVVKVAAQADLGRDVKAYVETRAKTKNLEIDKRDQEGLWHSDLGDAAVMLLLRLGKGDLASDLWTTNNPPALEDSVPGGKAIDDYLRLSHRWASLLFDRAADARWRRNDRVALCRLQQLARFARSAETEAKIHSFKPTTDKPRYFEFLGQLPELLADQQRRTTQWPRESIACIGPGRIADQKKRIAALIVRLDEVCTRNGIYRGDVDLSDDPVVAALISEGVAALTPLLECFEQDGRLTRSIALSGPRLEQWACLSVREAAFVAVCSILQRQDLLDRTDGHKISTGGAELRKDLAELVCELIKAAQQLPRAERWYALLADDKGCAEQWFRAASILVSPDYPIVPVRSRWRGRGGHIKPHGDQKTNLIGEPLRDNKKPSLGELLRQRIDQSKNVEDAIDLARALAIWEPRAALKPLADLMERAREKADWCRYVELVEVRTRLRDTRALDDYVMFVGKATPEMLGHAWPAPSKLFDPMVDHLNHPGMAQAAEKLFATNKSAWVPLDRLDEPTADATEILRLISTPLLRQPAFRNAVLKELGDKLVVGTVTQHQNGSYDIDGFGSIRQVCGGYVMPPKEQTKERFRVCDYFAYWISLEMSAAPRCELYWTRAERNKAVAACSEFLRKQQFNLCWQHSSLKLDKPATAAQVDNGEAVFSLGGEGQVRVVQGLKYPATARWTTLKDQPYQFESKDPRSGETNAVIKYQQDGRIIQAEEVLKDGAWQRYYGFVGVHHIARVPAEEIDLSLQLDQSERGIWVDIGHGFHARLSLPPVTWEPFEGFTPRFTADAAVHFTIMVRNASGFDQPSPTPQKSLQLRLLYSPEIVSPQGELVPKALRETDWKELPPKPDAKFQALNGRTMAPTEEMKLATIDLREWFDVKKQGFYRLQLWPVGNGSGSTDVGSAEIRFSLGAP